MIGQPFWSASKKLRNAILQHPAARDGMLLDVTGDKKVLDTIKPSLDKLLKDLPGQKTSEKLQDFYSEDHPWVVEAKKDMTKNAPMIDEGFIVPTQVSYVGKGGRLFDQGDRISGTASVVARYLRTGYLWDHVRVIGGAYGGMNMLAEGSGFFGFVSYRDPNLSKTIDVYDAAADALIASAEELEKDSDALATAIIGAVGDMDGALSPDQKGWAAFTRWLIRETPEARQRRRDEILNTKASDFKDFAERLRSMKNPSSAVVSSKGAFETAEKEGKSFSLTNVL